MTMKTTELKDVLHLYLGCEIQYQSDVRGKVFTELSPHVLEFPHKYYNFKLILRPLSDMTDEEAIELTKKLGGIFDFKNLSFNAYLNSFGSKVVSWGESPRAKYLVFNKNDPYNTIKYNQYQTIYLLKQGFDLFGLIESGQAIDKTTLNLK